MKIFIFWSTLAVTLYGAEQDEVTILKWAGPPGSKPGTYEEWTVQHPYTVFSYNLDRVVNGNGRQGTVAILTEQAIANAIADQINQVIDDLQLEGYDVLSYHISGGTPETLRTFLQDIYSNQNIEGALFIGDLPIAWFEIAHDYDSLGDYVEFPIDLFYMDLNGEWLDTMNTGNGKYDGHTGDINPEIYIGRLTPTGLGVDTLLLRNYLRKSNAYKYDTLFLTQRALFFVDDDWIPFAYGWAWDVSLLYPDTMNYWNSETTRASVYRAKLDTVHAWVSLFAHSWPGGHQLVYNNGNSYDYYYSNEYNTQDPPSNFYNFFCCSFCRFTDNGYGGGYSIFNPSHGLAAIGSTKTGSMLDFYYFYVSLSQGKTLGEAFKDWFTHITNNGVTFDELCWHYGMTLLGDPWLKPVGHHLSTVETEYNSTSLSELEVIGNPVLEELKLMFSLESERDVKISLFDCMGRKITDLINKKIEPGQHILRYRFADRTGNILPHGIYILRAVIDSQVITRKVIKI